MNASTPRTEGSGDSSCLLVARGKGIDPEDDDPEDAYEMFMESYGEIEAFNEGMRFNKLAVMTLLSYIPYLGPLFSFMVNIFWGEVGDHDKALIDAIQKWTTEYVGSAIAASIHERMQAKFDTMARGFKAYDQCKSHVKEKEKDQKDQLEAQISKCDNILMILCFASEEAMNEVNRSSYRGRLMSDFVMASTIKMTLWRERYDSAAYYKEQTGNESTLFPNLTEAKTSMKGHYKRIEEDLASMVLEWKRWRYDKIDIKDDSERDRESNFCSKFSLKDGLKPQYNRKFDNIECKEDGWYVDAPKLRDTLRDMHFRRVQFSEMIPVLKMFTGLALYIPGQEHFELQSGKVLPQYLELGPFSSWINGETEMQEGNMDRLAYPDEEVPQVHGQRWDILEVKKDRMLDQMIFKTDWEMWTRVVLKYPEIAGGDKSQEMRLPYDQCGLHLGFREGMLQSWITFEIKNLTKVWNATGEAQGYFNTGAYVCGLYKFQQITKIRSDAKLSGDAFMVNFKFVPGEAHR